MLEARLEAAPGEGGGVRPGYALSPAQEEAHRARIRQILAGRLSRPSAPALAQQRVLVALRGRVEAAERELDALEGACARLEALCLEAEERAGAAEARLGGAAAARREELGRACAGFEGQLDAAERRLDVAALRRQLDALVAALHGRRWG